MSGICRNSGRTAFSFFFLASLPSSLDLSPERFLFGSSFGIVNDDPDVALADVESVEDAPVVASLFVALVAIFFVGDASVVTPLTVDDPVVSSVRLGFTQTLFWNFPDLLEDLEHREEFD